MTCLLLFWRGSYSNNFRSYFLYIGTIDLGRYHSFLKEMRTPGPKLHTLSEACFLVRKNSWAYGSELLAHVRAPQPRHTFTHTKQRIKNKDPVALNPVYLYSPTKTPTFFMKRWSYWHVTYSMYSCLYVIANKYPFLVDNRKNMPKVPSSLWHSIISIYTSKHRKIAQKKSIGKRSSSPGNGESSYSF